ncbi:MAG: DKNYY domain-containing protein [Methylophilaceae bacterium]
MTERTDYQTADGAVAVIPYDTFEAANMFLATGRSKEEVLPLIGLSNNEWEKLREAYRWFPTCSGKSDRERYFAGLHDDDIFRRILPPRWSIKPDDAPNLQSTLHISEAVRHNPHIGPFADCHWSATWIGAHPVATLLLGYTHDGSTVYFDGNPLTNREGEAILVDASSFEIIGGRWLRDKNNVYGQGEFGARPTLYWYVIEDADCETFEVLNLRYARDKNQAYYITRKTIRTKSTGAFEIVPELRLNYRDGTIDPLYDVSVIARDLEAVYFYGTRLKKAKPEMFQLFGHGYATDGTFVWFLEEKKLIEGADAKTFTVPIPGEPHVAGRYGGHCVTDRYRPYDQGEPCDPQEWVEQWRPFFKARSDIHDWWWHKLVGDNH